MVILGHDKHPSIQPTGAPRSRHSSHALPLRARVLLRGGSNMTVTLHHTIIASYDKKASAEFFARIVGLDPPTSGGRFVTVHVWNGVALDFDNLSNDPQSMHFASDVRSQHYAFLVSEDDFDGIFERVKAEG